LASTVQEWIETPVMTVERIGHGAGMKDFLEQPNLLRIFLGEFAEKANPAERDQVWILETNLDDVSGEVVGHCFDLLFAAGALDVSTPATGIKKSRRGLLLSVIVPSGARDEAEAILFRETRTFGIRRYPVERSKLQRESMIVQTPWGPV